ncbi:MAG: AIR synthase-related protein, partial [Candidatus Parcubacteria bacterium]|nr:AIR synthase-related protein [Candidatus Parcubacteria bacterium]
MMSVFYRVYRQPLLSAARTEELTQSLAEIVPEISGLETEKVFCLEASRELTAEEIERLKWLLGGPDRVKCLSDKTFFSDPGNVIEIGPRLHFETANSTNAVSICQSCELPVIRLEEARRYKFISVQPLGNDKIDLILPLLHDKMTECPYPNQLTTFVTDKKPEPVKYIPVMEQGMDALVKANAEYGTGMDKADLQYYLYLFTEVAKRNPTDVEWCDLGNCNSEHSRHHVFRAKLIIDGQAMPFTLMDIIKSTLTNLSNSIIAFDDNASAIKGVPVSFLIPERPGLPSPVRMAELLFHYVLTCETHNHPCLWAAYPGAGTGGGGRRRDNQGLGRGGLIAACSAGFLGGNLNIPGYPLDWEDPNFAYDPLCESPLKFFRKAVNGAFDDGNQCGEPVILTFFESFGLRIGPERWEYIKPIMFTGGFGFLDDRHVKKHEPVPGWLIVRIGGKAYEVGFGGGAASSLMGGQNIAALDFKSVQRANGEMARKTDQVIRTCIMMGDNNPIETIHDQGAGGPGNVLKEIMAPAGGRVDIRNIILGDKTMSPVAIWVSEFQENMAMLIKPERWEEFKAICDREKVPCAVVGTITGDGKVVVIDSQNNTTLFDLSLQQIFGEYPQKTFEDTRRKLELQPLNLPEDLSVAQALAKTFKLLQVGSQEWAVHVVDRSVTPHVVQQQCVGPWQLPINKYSVIAPSPFSHTGMANSVGTKPIIGLISPQASARMSAAEALLKLMFVPVSKRDEIKASINWMLAAKVPGG